MQTGKFVGVDTRVRACAALQYVSVGIHITLFAMVGAEVRAYTEVEY